jgi:hypothetical protein
MELLSSGIWLLLPPMALPKLSYSLGTQREIENPPGEAADERQHHNSPSQPRSPPPVVWKLENHIHLNQFKLPSTRRN